MVNRTNGYKNITSRELRERLERKEDFLLLDVRTPAEHFASTIEGAVLLPVQELAFRIKELPRDKELVVYCRVGNRSTFAAEFLARQGFTVTNLAGGILEWELSAAGAYAAA